MANVRALSHSHLNQLFASNKKEMLGHWVFKKRKILYFFCTDLAIDTRTMCRIILPFKSISNMKYNTIESILFYFIFFFISISSRQPKAIIERNMSA